MLDRCFGGASVIGRRLKQVLESILGLCYGDAWNCQRRGEANARGDVEICSDGGQCKRAAGWSWGGCRCWSALQAQRCLGSALTSWRIAVHSKWLASYCGAFPVLFLDWALEQ